MEDSTQNSILQIFAGIFAVATIAIGLIVMFFPPTANKVKTIADLEAEYLGQRDDAYVTEIAGELVDFGDRSLYLGTVTAVNRQQIPVADGVITIQLVVGNAGDITQIVTDEEGVAAFEYDVTGLGSFYFEILDITGDNWVYAPELSLQTKLSVQ
jgi:hypothetical protein